MPKHKGIDPRNWGNIQLDPNEHDVEIQQALLNNYSRNKNETAPKAQPMEQGNTAIVTPFRERSVTGPAPDKLARLNDTQPINQIPADSYLGRTLANMERLRTTPQVGSDPSNSGGSSSSSSSDDDESSSHNSGNNRKNKRRKSRKKKGKSKKKKSKKSTLKPVVPKEYDGTPDSRLFNRFVTEGTTYVLDGRVEPDRQVLRLSYYLKGIAYDFYMQRVSLNFDQWTLPQFFEELFNYCFPVNFRLEQRNKLQKTY